MARGFSFTPVGLSEFNQLTATRQAFEKDRNQSIKNAISGIGRGIIENSIKQINSPNELIAWLGPCISQEKMEVGKEVYNFFQGYDKNTCEAFKEKSKDKLSLNLTSAAKIKLIKLGVQLIYGNSITQHYCTFKEPDKFFSYRRDKITGRMASLIWIDK